MSALVGHAGEYLQLRRSLGHDLAEAHRLLPRFVAYLDVVGAETVTVAAALAWAQQPAAAAGSSVWARRMTVARGFACYMAGVDARTEVPPVGLVTFRQRRRPPFIFSPADIAALMAQAHQAIPNPMRAATIETLIGLLAASGMRVGEAIGFERCDVDWPEALIVVRNTKFGKSRIVALHPTTVDALSVYAQQRDKTIPHPKSATFFLSTAGSAVLASDFGKAFRALLAATSVGVGAPRPPRVHDLRHSLAVNTLTRWYRDGDNVEVRLAALATHLGHKDPASTYWYLSAVPELLACAAGRLQAAQETRP